MTKPRPLPPPSDIRRVYRETGFGGGWVSMNRAEKTRAAERPWYRRVWGLPTQREVDSWNLDR